MNRSYSMTPNIFLGLIQNPNSSQQLLETGSSPAIVAADDKHFNEILIKPPLKSIMLFDTFGISLLLRDSVTLEVVCCESASTDW